MIHPGPFVSSRVLQGLDAFLARRNVKFSDVVTTANLTPDDIDPQSNKTVPLDFVISILDAAAVLTRSPCFGAEWSEAYDPTDAGVYGYLLMHSSSVREALAVTVRYLPLIIHPVAIELKYEADAAVLSWRLSPTLQSRSTQYLLFATGATIARLRAVGGKDLDPLRVELPCPDMPCKTLLKRVFGPSIFHETGKTRIVVSGPSLDRRNDNADPKVFELLRDLAERMLKEMATETAIARVVRRMVSDRLGQKDVSLEMIAEKLHMTPRALQTRLAAEHTSFEALVQMTKQDAAEYYLRETDLSLTEIALRLGFSELSAFTRACQRWFKEPPSALRQHLRLANDRDN
jgi:AraC-like DNA-binding protein